MFTVSGKLNSMGRLADSLVRSKTYRQELHDLFVIFRDQKHERHCISHLSCSDYSFSEERVGDVVAGCCVPSLGMLY